MSEHTAEWGVESPGGDMWTYHDETVARIVAAEQRKALHRRTVTRSPWTLDTPAAKTGADR